MSVKVNLASPEKVFDAVTRRTPSAVNLRIVTFQQKFLNGALYTVSFDSVDAGETKNYINKVYVHGRSYDVYGFDHELLSVVGATHESGWAVQLARPALMTSLIAIIVTVLVVVWAGVSLFGLAHGEIPDFLSSGFLLILGFYFGKAAKQDE